MKTLADSSKSIFPHLRRLVDADGQIRLQVLLVSAEQLVQRLPVMPAPKIIDCHITGCLWAGIAFYGMLQAVHDVIQVFDIQADNCRSNGIFDGRNNRLIGVAGNCRGGRGFAVAPCSIVSSHDYNDIFRSIHPAQRRLKRLFQGDTDTL